MEKIKNIFKGFLSVEALLVIAIYIADRFSYNMFNAIQATNALNNLEIGAAVVGVIASLYTFSGLLFRVPSSNLLSKVSPRICLAVCFVVKIAIYALMAVVPVGNVVFYGILRCLYALCWSFLGVALPALLAMVVDSRFIGTAFGIFNGVMGTLTAPSRPWALSMFETKGATHAFLVIAALAIVPLVLSLLFDYKKFQTRVATLSGETKNLGTKEKAKFQFTWKLVPICVFASLPLWTWQLHMEYLPKLAETVGFEYLGALGIGSAIEGWVTFLSCALCDVINPGIVSVIMCLFWGAGTFLIGSASADTVMLVPFLIYAIGQGALSPVTVAMMKSVSIKDQPNLSGTLNLCKDIVSVIGGTLNGLIITSVGFVSAYKIDSIFPIILALFCVYYFFLRKKKVEPQAEEPAASA